MPPGKIEPDLIELEDHQATRLLGKRMAAAVSLGCAPGFAILLFGGLGAGKTTLIRALVESLPGGLDCEVASPSFNLVNSYPSSPPVGHFDLYRQPAGIIPEELWEWLDDPAALVVVEWAERICPAPVIQGSRSQNKSSVDRRDPSVPIPPGWLPDALCISLVPRWFPTVSAPDGAVLHAGKPPASVITGRVASIVPHGNAARLFTERLLKG